MSAGDVVTSATWPAPVALKRGVWSMHVCVPGDFSDADVEAFAECDYPAGTTHGWSVVQSLGRVTCADREQRRGCVHVVLTV